MRDQAAASLPRGEFNEEGWWVMRARGKLGGRVIIDATGKMVAGLDLSLQSVKGANAAVELSQEEARALAAELLRVAVDEDYRDEVPR